MIFTRNPKHTLHFHRVYIYTCIYRERESGDRENVHVYVYVAEQLQRNCDYLEIYICSNNLHVCEVDGVEHGNIHVYVCTCSSTIMP